MTKTQSLKLDAIDYFWLRRAPEHSVHSVPFAEPEVAKEEAPNEVYMRALVHTPALTDAMRNARSVPAPDSSSVPEKAVRSASAVQAVRLHWLQQTKVQVWVMRRGSRLEVLQREPMPRLTQADGWCDRRRSHCVRRHRSHCGFLMWMHYQSDVAAPQELRRSTEVRARDAALCPAPGERARPEWDEASLARAPAASEDDSSAEGG